MFILTIKDLRKYIVSIQVGNIISKYTDMCKAVDKRFINILRYHKENKNLNWFHAMKKAIIKDNLNIVKVLLNETGYNTNYTYKLSYVFGRKRISKWIKENYISKPIISAKSRLIMI